MIFNNKLLICIQNNVWLLFLDKKETRKKNEDSEDRWNKEKRERKRDKDTIVFGSNVQDIIIVFVFYLIMVDNTK